MPDTVIDPSQARAQLVSKYGAAQVDLWLKEAVRLAAIERNRLRYRHDLFGFCHDVLGFHDLIPEAKAVLPGYSHEALCGFLQDDTTLFKLILMPRYSFKSHLVTIGRTLWRLVSDPNLRFLFYSDVNEKAEGFLDGVKNHILGKVEGSTFREKFGAWEVDPKKGVWNQQELVIRPRTHAQVEPTIDTAGLETSKVAKHYDEIIFDDLVTDKNVTTHELIEKVKEVYRKSLSLLRPGGQVTLLGTPWDFNDLYAVIQADEEERAKQRQPKLFSVFRCPAEVDGKHPFASIGLTPTFLRQQKVQQGSYIFSCNPYEAPIIMGDFTAKPIGEVREGDQVIGWEKSPYNRRMLVRTVVKTVQSRVAEVVRITLESGRQIRCTPDHFWWTGRNDPTHREYKPAKVGSPLLYIFEPTLPALTPALQSKANWLGGFYDGEGDCVGSIVMSQSKIVNPEVCATLEQTFKDLQFTYGVMERQPTRTTLGKPTNYYWLNGGLQGKRRFLLYCQPSKRAEIERSMLRHGHRFVQEYDKVESIEPDGREIVYALQTETGNYIAWGYGSKNCLYNLLPLDESTAIFKASNFAFYDSARVPEGLFITASLDPIPRHEASSQGDDAALTIVGTDQQMNLCLLDAVAGRLQPDEQIDAIFVMHAKWGIKVLALEAIAFQRELRPAIERRIEQERAKNQNFRLFEIKEITSRDTTKVNRIRALQPYHERQAIKFPGTRLELLTGVWAKLASQMLKFPKSSHDDLLDSLADHLGIHRAGSPRDEAKTYPWSSAAWFEQEQRRKRWQDSDLPPWSREALPEPAFS